jgi:hypothetical protein
MTEEICLIEVAAWFPEKGEPYWSDQLDDYLWIEELKTIAIKQPTDDQAAFWANFQIPVDTYFDSENVGFSFQVFGQSTDKDWSCALDWVIDAIGIKEVFEDWLSDLEKIARMILAESNKRKLEKFPEEKPSKSVKFVTAWSYHGYKEPDTPNGPGEWEEEWELIGRVDLGKIPFSIVKVEDNQ